MKASVIIPTKNAGAILHKVLPRVLSQQTDWPFEVIVIDSGSSDGTVDYVRSLPDVTLIQISPSEFGHGRTRNLAISRASGEFCALLTHDALPENDRWLANLVAPLEEDPEIAGVFGRHIAYAEHGAYMTRDLERHFQGFNDLPRVVSRAMDPERYESDRGWRQILHFYSDNNSCLRRSVWETIPYPDVEFAEDQIWADSIISAGLKKAYASAAAVYHSHDYDAFDQFRRAFDESLSFLVLFGYRLGFRSFRKAIAACYRMAKRDWIWGRQNGVPVRERLHRMAQDVALVAGHSLGSVGNRMPKWLRERLSRDKRLFRQLSR